MSKRRRLDAVVTTIQRQYGPSALRRGVNSPAIRPPQGLPTGFATLDALTGCNGIPQQGLTLLSGHATSGKLTLAYKILAAAQNPPATAKPVALLDLTGSTDPDYLRRCQVDLDRLFLIRPRPETVLPGLMLDLVNTGQLGLLLVDSLADLLPDPSRARQFSRGLPGLLTALRRHGCALVMVEEPAPPWRRWLGLDVGRNVRQQAALHLELRRDRWLTADNSLRGYQAQVVLHRSRWARSGARTHIGIEFNGVVQARESW